MLGAVITVALILLLLHLVVSYIYGLAGLKRAFRWPRTSSCFWFDSEVRACRQINRL